ncbi:hypothetical protein CKM354_001262900 [Cercospora kikuchii]|uniref:Par3/HAL N-terminal domain-containing protein n=1 Tax=Cercospora kikuchii TaxID=84275 RepID=A0A9P3L1I9_9PEZI|nr:uncharacterized protein CKM354_001262900 [Cercospora kikuchii]GIZ49599.1 hypothetical protein CKM354_001262900 [Cercospora kikuchii]
MQRFTVAIVDSTTPGTALTLAVPFDSSALVSAFIEELFRRAAKQGLKLAPSTHIAALHLDSETGAIIDPGDLLSDVVTDSRNDKIFAVFTRQGAPHSGSDTEGVRHQLETSRLVSGDDGLVIRFITPNLAKKSRLSLPTVIISKSATVKDLHKLAAHHLGLPAAFAEENITNECNCNLVKQISEVSGPADKIFIVHGKSIVEHSDLQDSSEAAVNIAIESATKGAGSAERKIVRHGGELHLGRYSRPPVVAICSKSRHIPLHARVDDEDTASEDDLKHHVVDLHTSEQPICASIMSCELHKTGLLYLAKDGVIDIFVVNRTAAGTASATIGRSAIFRARPHWEPSISQNPRGIAMFLSSLRVFTSLISAADSDRRTKDAVLHLMDLISKFPPCVRALLLLIDGKTVSPPESAAIAHAVYEALHSALIPTGIIGSDTSRVFEGSRLLFGFILEKARTTKLSSSTAADDDLPYLASLESFDVRDLKTGEAVLHPVQTKSGILERSLFSAFDEGGVLAHSHLQPRLAQMETPSAIGRHALLAGGASPAVLIFNVSRLMADYRYPDAGHPQGAFDAGELSQLSHLAEVAARNQLSVHRPTQLASAGESTMNTTVVEQLIAPIIKQYESDGSAVFDSFGGAVLRRLQAPDEMLFFCVDTSASMRSSSDFREVNEQHPDLEPDLCAQDIVDANVYTTVTFDTMKDCLSKYEAFKDMLGILASKADIQKQRWLASEVIDMYRMLLDNDIVAKHERMADDRENARSHFARQAIIDAESTLNGLKAQWAGCQTHHEALQDFLIYRANSSADINMDCGLAFEHPPQMTGLPLQSQALVANDELASAVISWIRGADMQEASQPPAKKARLTLPEQRAKITFLSKDGAFDREINSETTVADLYQLAFRGLKGRFMAFQLALHDSTAVDPSPSLAHSHNINDGDQIFIRIADENSTTSGDSSHSASGSGQADDHALIKVYRHEEVNFSFWVPRSTSGTTQSIIWKYWRYQYQTVGWLGLREVQIWTDLHSNGDGLKTGMPRSHTVPMSWYLKRTSCNGKLEDEPLCGEEATTRNGQPNDASKPLVIKVDVQAIRKSSSRQAADLEPPRCPQADV